MGLKYSVNEFISLIADGTLHHSDIIDYAGEVDDVKELLISLWLSNIACVESTGKPLVTTCQEERRIDYAISIISKRFNINVLDDDNELDLPGEQKQSCKPLHFIYSADIERIDNLYKYLVSGNYIDVDIVSFRYWIIGAETEQELMQIKWKKSLVLLGYLIDNLFADTNATNLWEVTKASFTIKSEKINKSSIKTSVSKWKNNETSKPKGYRDIDGILTKF